MPRKPLSQEEKAKLAAAKAAKKAQEKEALKAELLNDSAFKAELLKSLGKSTEIKEITPNKSNTPIAHNEVPDEYLLDAPVHFYAWRFGLILLGYTDKGRDILPPDNRPITFKALAPINEVDNLGKRHRTEWCCFTTWDKRVVAWMKKHPFYQMSFCEGMEDFQKTTLTGSNQLLKSAIEVSKLNRNQIIEMCRNNGIQMESDFNAMRDKLVKSLANSESSKMKFATEDIARRNSEVLK